MSDTITLTIELENCGLFSYPRCPWCIIQNNHGYTCLHPSLDKIRYKDSFDRRRILLSGQKIPSGCPLRKDNPVIKVVEKGPR